jgi:hypothetical protein
VNRLWVKRDIEQSITKGKYKDLILFFMNCHGDWIYLSLKKYPATKKNTAK